MPQSLERDEILVKILQFHRDTDSEWNLRKTFATGLKSEKISTIL